MTARRIALRILILSAALALAAACVYGGILGVRVWGLTSYCFVFLFLLVIFFSNLYAKLAQVYLEA